MEKELASRISFVTPRSFDPSKPMELQVKLEKKWEVIEKNFSLEKVNETASAASSASEKDFSIEKVNETASAASSASENPASGTNFGSRKVVKIVCMSDTHSTQGEFG